MNSKHIMMTIACAAAFSGSVRAETNEINAAESPAGWNWAMGEGFTYDEMPIVSPEFRSRWPSKAS